MLTITKPDATSQIRSLSSGTMTTLLTDAWFEEMRGWFQSRMGMRRRSVQVNPKQAKDHWIVDRMQDGFRRFSELPGREWSNWQDCWRGYLDELAKVRFKCSYMGAVWYEIPGHKTFEHKCSVSKYESSIYNGDQADFESRVVPYLGTIVREHGREDYPSDECAVLFPLWIPAHCDTENDWMLELSPDYPAPKLGKNLLGNPCSWDEDARFEPSNAEWEEWRTIAGAK